MSHFIDICECGKVLVQCKCIGDKTRRVVSPCEHVKQTDTITTSDDHLNTPDALTESQEGVNRKGIAL